MWGGLGAVETGRQMKEERGQCRDEVTGATERPCLSPPPPSIHLHLSHIHPVNGLV